MSATQFAVNRDRDDADAIDFVAVRGEIDIFTAPDVKRAASEAIEAGATRLVIDLTESTFVDSTALGMIIGLAKRVRPAGGDVVLVNVDADIARTLAITGLDEIFHVVDRRSAAAAAFEAGPRSREG
ncbi:MAG: STAS domain-containing protein [Solirubrobacteraceae bacterium]|nr:STAS domain-containing protein [Solirubrobacteraceae bacterium]